MKSLMELLREVLADAGTWCGVSTSRDFETVTTRVGHEGLSFLTITLPRFGQDFERSLALERVGHDLFLGFRRKGSLPLFLGGFFDRVFDRKTGVLRADADPTSVQAIRQICHLFGKILLPASEKRQRKALEGYIRTEVEVQQWSANVSPDDLRLFGQAASALYLPFLARLERDVWENYTHPKHGPGSTADGLSGNQKYRQRVWHERLEKCFPMGEYLIPSHRYWKDLQDVELRAPEQEEPVKVILVPKTLKTPRVIAMEPTCMMYAQQSLMVPLVEGLERDDYLSPFVGFTDRGPNQTMAQVGSLDGSLATLDLSEASDRVSNLLVLALFRHTPFLSECVQSCRSLRGRVNEDVINLSKFASMGSALTFPIEEMVFLTIVFLAASEQAGHQLSRAEFSRLKGKVRIYGDDIIVPTDLAPYVVRKLEAFGFKINAAKSFTEGNFRESCGAEYFRGHDVSITRVRRALPERRTDSSEIVSLFSLRNQFYWRGYWRVVPWLDVLLRRFAPAPYVLPTSPVLGLQSALGLEDPERICKHLQVPLVRGLKVRSTPPVDRLDGVGALLKVLLHTGDEPMEVSHLERFGRSPAVRTKLAWAPPF